MCGRPRVQCVQRAARFCAAALAAMGALRVSRGALPLVVRRAVLARATLVTLQSPPSASVDRRHARRVRRARALRAARRARASVGGRVPQWNSAPADAARTRLAGRLLTQSRFHRLC